MKARMLIAAGLIATASSLAAQESNPLPDGETTRFGAFSAWLIGPTAIYQHGALGDAIEAEGFVMKHNGSELSFRLPRDQVFEDRRVRLQDLDGDGVPEALVVRADVSKGAALALYQVSDGKIELKAQSMPIGRKNRWLNPVGIADFSGSGEPLIAAVVTPHLSGSLRFFRISGQQLVEIGGLDGVTNHINGSRDLDLSRIADIDGDGSAEIIIPSLDRTRLVVVSFRGGQARIDAQWQVPSPIETISPVRNGRIELLLSDNNTRTLSLDK